jgi:hypothetical protein
LPAQLRMHGGATVGMKYQPLGFGDRVARWFYF